MKNLFSKILTKFDSNKIENVRIGNQTWTKNNLNVTTFRNGDPILITKSNDEWKNAGIEGNAACCYLNNDPANGEKYGMLYNWYAVADSRGLAPEGWHVPSDEEFLILADALGGAKNASNKMRSTYGWNKSNGNNESGFSGLPGGYIWGSFMEIGKAGY
jgi:uncharacterized protein (TIGR02145 family)